MRVLLISKQTEFAKRLKNLLEKNNMAVDLVHKELEPQDFLYKLSYDVIILENSLSSKLDLQILKQLKKEPCAPAVMLLVLENQAEEGIAGLEAGADDYLTVPFIFREFVARVKALGRRSIGKYKDNSLFLGNTKLDCNCYELMNQQKGVKLYNKEFQLMELFFCYPGYVFSSEHLMDTIWGNESAVGIEVVWTYICFLRKKLKELDADIEIKTTRGVGYSLELKME